MDSLNGFMPYCTSFSTNSAVFCLKFLFDNCLHVGLTCRESPNSRLHQIRNSPSYSSGRRSSPHSSPMSHRNSPGTFRDPAPPLPGECTLQLLLHSSAHNPLAMHIACCSTAGFTSCMTCIHRVHKSMFVVEGIISIDYVVVHHRASHRR